MQEILKVFGVEWELLLVNIVNFGVLLLGLTYLLYKPVVKALDERSAKIEKGLKDAKLAEEKLQESESEKMQIISQAKKEAQESVAQAKDLAKKEADKILQEAQAKSLTTLEMTRRQAQDEKDAMLKSAKEEVAKEAVLVAEKILKSQS